MRLLLKTCLAGIGVVAFALLAGLAWLSFDTSGLPDTQALAQFAPATMTQVTDSSRKSASVAIPYDSIGDNMRAALRADEIEEDGPGVLASIYRAFSDRSIHHHIAMSTHISRMMCYTSDKHLKRALNEIRFAVQLERRFSRRELFTIFANRIYLGENIIGVEAASQHYFHKEPNQLRIAEAALLAGMVRSPSRYSPTKHPDRALQRRNEVIDAMLQARSISDSDALVAKSSPLLVVHD